MLKLVTIVATLAAMATARPWYPWPGFPYYHGYPYLHSGYYGYGGYSAPAAPRYNPKLIYYGHLEGSCEGARDGLYYVDEYSFAYCSNGQKSIQPCADGSANPALSHFLPGGYYGFYDFCSVNLVANGYTGQVAVPPKEQNGYAGEEQQVGYGQEEPAYNEKTYFEENHSYEERAGDNKVY